jgi:uncharacterized membrane protein
MNLIAEYFLYFIIYAFLGWTMEVVCKLFELKKFINRGFLVGPICPIYGYGVLFIVLLIGSAKGDLLAVFLKSILVCSLLEYLTSYFMEKLFKARWWDYSRRKFNLNGRICLETMIPFGLLGVFVIYILHPFIKSIVGKISINIQLIMSIIIFIIYIIDNGFSYFIMHKIKNKINETNKDNTEAIKKYMINWLNDNSIFYRRIKNAYPNFIIKVKMINDSLIEINNQAINNYEKSKEELKNKIQRK